MRRFLSWPRLARTLGGALIAALPKLGDAFYVLYGDSYLPIDYRAVGDFFLRSGQQGLMTVYENHGRYDTSNVWFEGGEIRRYDKKEKLPQMHHIDYGLGLFRAAAFDGFPRNEIVDLAASFQRRVVETLVDRVFAAARWYGAKSIGIAGGVSANSRLRAEALAKSERNEIPVYIPRLALSTDNAAMIAAAGLRQVARQNFAPPDLNAMASMPL